MWDSSIAGEQSPRCSFSLKVKGTVYADSIQLNTTGRSDLRPFWYHDFFSDTNGDGFPDSYARGNAGYILQKQVFPDGSPIITLTSSDPSVAFIENGRTLRAVKPGVCNVTATCDGVSVTVPFTVLGGIQIKTGTILFYNKPAFIDINDPQANLLFDGAPTVSLMNVTPRIFATIGTIPTTISISGATGGAVTVSYPSATFGTSQWGQLSVNHGPQLAGKFNVRVADQHGNQSAFVPIFWVRNRRPDAPSGNPWDNNAELFHLMLLDRDAQMAYQQLRDSPRASEDPVFYATGDSQMWEDDLDAAADLLPWRRSYSNLSAQTDGPLGRAWMVDAQPAVTQTGNFLIVALRADVQVAFTVTGGVYVPVRNHLGVLQNQGNDLIFADVSGVRMLFHGLGVTPVALRGRVKALFTPGGDRISYEYDNAGQMIVMSRQAALDARDELRFRYRTDGPIERVERHRVSGANSTLVQAVNYVYYTGSTGQYGEYDCLKAAQVVDPQGTLIREYYYRYYREGESGGFSGALRVAIGPRNCARLRQQGQDPLTTTWTNTALAPYTDKAFTYDGNGRVTQQVLQTSDLEGSGTYGYAYTPRTNPPTDPGPNDWLIKTVETLPDGAQTIVYSNREGQMLLRARLPTAGATAQWVEAWRYNALWRLEWHILPDAFQNVAGQWYNETNTDLIALTSGNSPFIKDNAGQIRRWTYFTSTDLGSGAVAGYPQHEYDQIGDQGALILRKTITYTGRTQ